jgi:hypothetical protein
MAKQIKKRRVYPAESDPRQAVSDAAWQALSKIVQKVYGETESLAREFGPWVRGADGRWKRDRRKR